MPALCCTASYSLCLALRSFSCWPCKKTAAVRHIPPCALLRLATPAGCRSVNVHAWSLGMVRLPNIGDPLQAVLKTTPSSRYHVPAARAGDMHTTVPAFQGGPSGGSLPHADFCQWPGGFARPASLDESSYSRYLLHERCARRGDLHGLSEMMCKPELELCVWSADMPLLTIAIHL